MPPEAPKPQAKPGAGSRQRIERRLAAVLYADIVDFTALMQRAEEGTHRRVGTELQRMARKIERAHGRPFGIAGDALMAEFPSPAEALRCALAIHASAARRNAKLPADERMVFRIGLNLGEIMVQGDRTGGTAVNVAARLQALAEPGGICLSAAVFDQVRRTVPAAYQDLGEQRLKNVRDPVAAYVLPAAACGFLDGASPGAPAPARPVLDTSGDYRPSLAVLPFRTLQPDQADAYFAEGIIDDIIRALGGLQDLLVISRSSTAGFARQPLDVRRVGRELDVRYVLHGSVRRSGDLLRIAVELCAAVSGEVIWADRFDGRLADLFDLQDRIASRVATAISPQLREQELERALRKHPGSMTAYDLTLQALGLSHRMDRDGLQQAIALLEQACSLDPGYAQGFSSLALTRIWLLGQGWSQDEAADHDLVAKAAQQAIEQDRNNALGLAIYGHQKSFLLKDYATASVALEHAINIGPSCAWAWFLSSITCGYIGDTATAIIRAEKAVRLSPIGADAFWFEHCLAQSYYLSDRFEDAVSWGQMSHAHNGANTANLRCLIASLVATGRLEAARLIADQHRRIAPDFTLTVFLRRTPLPGAVGELFAQRLQQAGFPA